jgi:hypothetical protein
VRRQQEARVGRSCSWSSRSRSAESSAATAISGGTHTVRCWRSMSTGTMPERNAVPGSPEVQCTCTSDRATRGRPGASGSISRPVEGRTATWSSPSTPGGVQICSAAAAVVPVAGPPTRMARTRPEGVLGAA